MKYFSKKGMAMNFQIQRNGAVLKSLFLKVFLFFLTISVFCFMNPAWAQTWSSSPGTGDWNTAGNWVSPSTVPNAQSAFATFGTSSTTSVSLSSGVSVSAIQFSSGASAFTINTGSNALGFFGLGIINNSSSTQTIINDGALTFNNASTASNISLTNNNDVNFLGSSTAGNSLITNYQGLGFHNSTTAGNATIINYNGLNLQGNSTAGSANITNNSGGGFTFESDATAGNATITNNSYFSFNQRTTAGNSTITNASSGTAYFNDDTTAGNSNITNNGSLIFTGQGNGVSFSTAGSATITNNSQMTFNDYSTAGSASITNNLGGDLYFSANSTAGTAAITNKSFFLFQNNSTAGSATIVNNNGAAVNFFDNATAGNSNITNNGNIIFEGQNNGVSFSTAGNATITNNDVINFYDYSAAGTAGITNNNVIEFYAQSTALNAAITNSGSGAITFYNNSTAGNSNIANYGSLTFNGQGNGVSFSTAGNATIANNNTLTFDDYSTAGSATITNNNQLSFNNYSTAGSSNITNASSGVVTFNDDSTAGHSNITNDGNLTFNGQGNGVSFSTAGSAVIANNKNIFFNDYSTAGNSTITNANGGGITFNDDSTAGNSNITNNNGNLVFTGQGNGVSFSTAGSATITDNYWMYFNDYSTAGNATIRINDTGSLTFNQNSTASNSNIANNNSYLLFYGNSSAGNSNITSSNYGSIQFHDNSTAGSATITTNNGYIWIANAASGGTARFVLGGSLDISGETTGIPVTIGSFEGSGSVSLGGNNLITGSNNLSTSFSGIISDGGYNGGLGGSLTKIGSGTLSLSGVGYYTGGTNINGGTLVAAYSNALGYGSVEVNGGTLSVGGPLTLNIGGDYTQTSSGTLKLGLGGTTTGLWDVLNISASSTLAGTLKLVSYNGFQVPENKTFELLDSTFGLTGEFGTVVDSIDEPVSIVYTSNEVILETLSFAQFGLTLNQRAVGGGLDSLVSLSADPALLNALDSLPTSALPATYDQISPSNLTPLYKMGFMAAQAQGGLIWQRLSEYWGNGGVNSPYAALDGESPMFASNMSAGQEAQIAQSVQSDRWGAFASGLGTFGTVTSDGNGTGYQFSTSGTTAGVDYRFSKDFVGGLLFGYDQSGTSQSTGTVNSTGGQVGLYAGLKADQLHIEALIDGGLDSYTTQRIGFGGTAAGNTSGMEYTGQLNMGFDFKMDNLVISPYVSGQYTQINVNGFSETGSLAPLTYGNQGESYLSSDLGSQFSLDLKMGSFHLLPNVSGAWEHVYQGNVDSLTANFGTGSNFTVDGSATGTDAAVLGGGLNAEFSKDFSVYAEYQGKMGMTNYTSQSFTGGINLFFGGSGAEKTYGVQTRTSNVEATATPMLTPSSVVSPAATLPNLVSSTPPQGTVPTNMPFVQTTPGPVLTSAFVVSPVVSPVATPVMASNATPIVVPMASPVIIPHSW